MDLRFGRKIRFSRLFEKNHYGRSDPDWGVCGFAGDDGLFSHQTANSKERSKPKAMTPEERRNAR